MGIALIGAGIYGYFVGTSWVFTIYFSTQGFIFVLFALSLVEAFNLQPPSEAKLLGLPEPGSTAAEPEELKPVKPPPKLKKKSKPKRRKGYEGVTANDLDDEMELDEFELGSGRNGHAHGADEDDDDDDDEEEAGVRRGPRRPPPAPPSLLRVLRANVIIFIYTLPINTFSIVLLYGVVTMALSEMINTQWDDVIALSLGLVIVPGHMCWCLGNPRANWEDRRLSRNGRLPLKRQLLQVVQLMILYFLLLLLFLVSMYSASATLQDYVSRQVYELTGKWLEEWID